LKGEEIRRRRQVWGGLPPPSEGAMDALVAVTETLDQSFNLKFFMFNKFK